MDSAVSLIFVPHGKDNLPNVIAQILIVKIGRKWKVQKFDI